MPPRLPPVLAPYDGRSSSASLPAADSYYSNEQIEILHDVVVAAQETLDTLPERERLPTNALFRAYDTVLPRHGIDPEGDHHISRLVFRVGGERGDGSLLDKLRTVLARMGIELQIDNVTASVSSATDDVDVIADKSLSTAHPIELGQYRRPTIPVAGPANTYQTVLDISTSRDADIEPANFSPLEKRDNDFHPAFGRQRDFEEAPSTAVSVSPSGAGETEQSRPSPQSDLGSELYRGASDTTLQTGDEESQQVLPPPSAKYSLPYSTADGLRGWRMLAPYARVGQSSRSRGQTGLDNQDHQRHSEAGHWEEEPATPENPRLLTRYLQLERRAKRAAEIYKTIRAFTHWEACTVEKLERTALARRHILRFRWFGSWSESASAARFAAEFFHKCRAINTWTRRLEQAEALETRVAEHLRRALLEGVFLHWHMICQNRAARTWSAQWLTGHGPRDADLQTVALVTGESENVLEAFAAWVAQKPRIASRISVPEAQSLPLSGVVFIHQKTDLVLSRHAINHWAARVSRLRLAKEGNRLMIQRRVLYDWSCLARLKKRQEMEDARREREALSWWNLQTRRQLIQRVYTTRLEKKVVELFGSQAAERLRRNERLLALVEEVNAEQAASAVSAALDKMTSRQRQLDHAKRAWAYYSSEKAVNRCLNQWQLALSNIQEMQLWSSRARAYYAMSKTLEFWRSETKRIRRERLKKAYAQARRALKRSRRASCMDGWRAATYRADVLMREGQRRLDARRQDHAFETWISALEKMGRMKSTAQTHLVSQALDTWARATGFWYECLAEAADVWTQRTVGRAIDKWYFKCLRLKAPQHIVEEMLESSKKKRIQQALAIWTILYYEEKCIEPPTGMFRNSQMLGWAGIEPSTSLRASIVNRLSSRGIPRRSIQPGLGRLAMYEEAEQAEAEDQLGALPFDNENEAGPMSTPTRSTSRLVPVIRPASTTPLAPLSTPAERELRQFFGGPQSLQLVQSRFSGRLNQSVDTDSPSTRGSDRRGASAGRWAAFSRGRGWVE